MSCTVSLVGGGPTVAKKREKSKVVELLKKMPTEVQQELLAEAGFEPPDGGEPDPLEGTPYAIRGGCLCWKKPTRDGQVILPLCNFTARVVRDVSRDDGAEVQRVFEVEGRLASGKRLPRIAVPAEKFFSMSWVGQWGIDAVISAGQGVRDRLREAIQLVSRGAVQEKIFVHLGWRKLDGRWAYFHAGGAIGAECVLVEPEAESLRRYELPEDGSPEEGMKASLRLLDIGPREALLPLWAAVWRAPTCCVLYPTVTLWLHGETGSYKSTVAALFLRHFGRFTKDSLPASWLATDNSLERTCFLARDTLLVIDDYAPEQHPRQAAELDRRVSRLVRQIGNRAARTRIGSDLRLRPETPPNALVVATGEQLPLGVQSVAARILPVRFERERFDLEKLTQTQAEAYLLAQAMRGYIEWLAPQMDDLTLRLPSRFEQLRAKAAVKGHARLPEAVAHLQLGAELGAAYAASLGVLGEAEARKLAEECFAALLTLAQEHAKTLHEERPTLKFLQTLDAIFAQGKGHLADRQTGEQPPMAYHFGWKARETEDGEGEYYRGGELLGWADHEGIYLVPEAAWRAVNEYLRADGGFPIRERTLRDMLAREGLLERDSSGKTTRVAVCEGTKRRVLVLNLNKYLSLLQQGVTGVTEPSSPDVARDSELHQRCYSSQKSVTESVTAPEPVTPSDAKITPDNTLGVTEKGQKSCGLQGTVTPVTPFDEGEGYKNESAWIDDDDLPF